MRAEQRAKEPARALTKGKSQLEVETMINLFSLTTDNLRSILTQMLICKRTPDVFETNL